MLFPKLLTLLSAMALTKARDTSKLMKTVPTISNSLVNLGKMEISFHFNGKHHDPAPVIPESSVHTDYYSAPQAAEESCPCNNFKPPSFLSDPSEIVNRILRSNDLFKDPTSTMCCESSEHVQESSVVFELNPNSNVQVPRFSVPRSQAFNMPSSQVQNFFRPMLSSFLPFSNGSKSKTVEVFMFPKKSDAGTFDFSNFLKPRKTKDSAVVKSDFQIIKEGGLPSTSVKKDLALSEKTTTETEYPTEELQTDAPAVTSGNTNTL